MNKIDTTCEHLKLRLIAAAIGLQECTRTDGTEVQIPGTDKRILIGGDAYLAKVALPATPAQVPAAEVRAQVPDVVREAIEATFEQRPGYLAKVGAAVRSLAQSGTADKACEVPAAVKKLFEAVEKGAAPFKVEHALAQLEADGVQVSIDASYLRDIFAEAGLIAAPSTADIGNTDEKGGAA